MAETTVNYRLGRRPLPARNLPSSTIYPAAQIPAFRLRLAPRKNPYGEAMQEAITTIAQQHAEIERLRARIAELEQRP